MAAAMAQFQADQEKALADAAVGAEAERQRLETELTGQEEATLKEMEGLLVLAHGLALVEVRADLETSTSKFQQQLAKETTYPTERTEELELLKKQLAGAEARKAVDRHVLVAAGGIGNSVLAAMKKAGDGWPAKFLRLDRMELDGLALSLRMDVHKPPKSNKQGLVRAELERHITTFRR